MRIRTLVFLGAGIVSAFMSPLFGYARNNAPRTDAELDSAVEALLGRMTLAEKLGQMSQASRQPYAGHIEETTELIRRGDLDHGSTLLFDSQAGQYCRNHRKMLWVCCCHFLL